MAETRDEPSTRAQDVPRDPRTSVLQACMRIISERPRINGTHVGSSGSLGHERGTDPLFGSKDSVLLETIMWNEDQMARRRGLEIPRLERAVDRLARFIGIAAPVGRLDPVWLVWWHILARQENEEEIQKRIAQIAFGGAGPLFGAALAAEIGIDQVIVPRETGVLSACGGVLADVVHDYGQVRAT